MVVYLCPLILFLLLVLSVQFNAVTQSYLTLCYRLPCSLPIPRAYSNSCPLSWWCHSTISSSVVPFSCLQSSQHQGLFQWVSSLHKVAKLLEPQLQHLSFQWIFRTYFFYDWLVWSFWSPTPQFKRINSLAVSFLYGPTLTSILAYRRNHSFD